MKIKDIEAAVIEYCKLNNIPIIRGSIPPQYKEQVRRYLVTLKKSYKNKKAYEKKLPSKLKVTAGRK